MSDKVSENRDNRNKKRVSTRQVRPISKSINANVVPTDYLHCSKKLSTCTCTPNNTEYMMCCVSRIFSFFSNMIIGQICRYPIVFLFSSNLFIVYLRFRNAILKHILTLTNWVCVCCRYILHDIFISHDPGR